MENMPATFNTETKTWQGPKVSNDFAFDTSIGAEVLKKLAETPERTLHICHDTGVAMTCFETRIAAIRVAQNLTKLGVKSGDMIGFICRNSIELPQTIYGSILIGAPINLLDASFKRDDITHMFKQTKPKLVFCDADVYEETKISLNEISNDATIITLRGKVEGVRSIEDLLTPTGQEDSYEAPILGDSRETLAVILCSSGVTGANKGVCLSHANILSNIKLFNPPESFCSLTFSPIYWSTGLLSIIIVAFRPRDSKILTAQPFSVELLIHIIKKHNVSYFQAAPHQLLLLLQSPLLDPRDFTGVKIFAVTGSIVSEHLRKEFRDVFPRHPLIVSYGMSEACIAISTTAPTDSINGLTVGCINPNIFVKVVDKQDSALEIGQTGEILAKPEFKFLGYYDNPEATKNALDSEEFLKTGDIGFIDENGCVFIIDRKKEIMKHKGHQVNPSEIENIIESIEGVELVSVVGIPDKTTINLPAAVVVRRPGFEDLTEKFIFNFVAERLPEYKHLHGGVHFVDEIPMTPSGKIQKRFVKVIAIKEYNEKLAFPDMD